MSVRVGAKTYDRQNETVIKRADQRQILPTIEVPTIVIVGAQDMMTPLVLAEVIRDGIRGAQLHIIPECGHLPPIEKPDAVASLLREWMGWAATEPSPKTN